MKYLELEAYSKTETYSEGCHLAWNLFAKIAT